MEQDLRQDNRQFEQEGPLALLLRILEERKGGKISEHNLASITDEYLKTLREREWFPVEEATQFLVVASTLVYVKSKELIPHFQEDEEMEEELDLLRDRLALLKAYQAFGKLIGKQIASEQGFLPPKERKREVRFRPGPLEVGALAGALSDFLRNELPEVKKREGEGKKVRIRISVPLQELMNRFREFKLKRKEFTLRELVEEAIRSSRGEKPSHPEWEEARKKVYTLVSFLAALELVKKGELVAEQREVFGDIHFRRVSNQGKQEH